VQRLHQDLQASEAEQATRVHVIEDLQQGLREHEVTVQQLHQDLQASEADRAARLHVIYETQRRLEESEADRAARLDVIHALEQTIVRFSNPKSAAKHLVAAGLRKVGLYNFAKRHQTQFIRMYRGTRRLVVRSQPQQTYTAMPSMPPSAERQNPDTLSMPPLAERQSADVPSMQSSVQQQSSVISLIHSPLVNAFIDARSKPGELPDTLLETLYHCGRALRHVLCVHSTARNIQAGYMLSRAGAVVTCFAEPEYIAALERDGLRVVTKNLGEWMVNVGATPIEWDALLFDAQADWDEIQFLKGRLLPHHKIFINGVDGQEETIRQVWGAPHRITDQLFMYYAPPRSWLDPLWQQESNANPLDGWPRPSTPLVIPSTLPSGRVWPKISIITVTLNRAQFLEDCLCSVLRQGYPNLEYIVIDGGSSDGTLQLLERYGSELTYYVSEKDGGQSEALNKGFRRASGEIFAWLNSDDMYLPHTLIRAAMAFDTFGADMVVGGCSLIQGDDRTPFRTHHSYFSYFPIGKVVPLPLHQLLDVDNAWLQGSFFYQPEVFWTRSMWERAGAHVNESLFYSMDYELWLRMAYHQAKIVHIPDTLALYRVHAQQKTVGDSLPYVPELRRVSTDFHEAHPEI